jgi:hypothetical protein
MLENREFEMGNRESQMRDEWRAPSFPRKRESSVFALDREKSESRGMTSQSSVESPAFAGMTSKTGAAA